MLRLDINTTSKRPFYPIVEVKIRLSNNLNPGINHLYEYTLSGWQIRCKKHDPNILIDNPIFVYDDSLEYFGRVFLLRLGLNASSNRPKFPIIDIKITLLNDLNPGTNHLYQYKLSGWQVRCKKHDPNILIDNPILVYDDSLEVFGFLTTEILYADQCY
ncbi:hypothetical protein RF11_06465 [Thelohanellus kitauei]|uniref:Uncharacterized protein n=1 Tax=Thelohanellus kitauei TaxID=669202 RepID=A0A0C2MI23_THEKT|nr:hypothetical protein RF11_06465 [Thelohanellus kitauei]